MENFTNQELALIKEILEQLNFKAGGSAKLITTENIIKKVNDSLTQEKEQK